MDWVRIKKKKTINDIPQEVLAEIFGYVDDELPIALTCKDWGHIVKEHRNRWPKKTLNERFCDAYDRHEKALKRMYQRMGAGTRRGGRRALPLTEQIIGEQQQDVRDFLRTHTLWAGIKVACVHFLSSLFVDVCALRKDKPRRRCPFVGIGVIASIFCLLACVLEIYPWWCGYIRRPKRIWIRRISVLCVCMSLLWCATETHNIVYGTGDPLFVCMYGVKYEKTNNFP